MLLYYRLVYRLSLTQKKDSSKDGRSYEDRRVRIGRIVWIRLRWLIYITTDKDREYVEERWIDKMKWSEYLVLLDRFED